jgi:nickel/cobalt exporter
METLFALQRWIYTAITSELGGFAVSGSVGALVSVLPLGILFGALHALTPGHGKAILASVIVGSRMQLAKGTAMATVLAVTHVGSAVIVALAANFLIARTIGGAGRAPLLEHISRALLVMVGVWMIFRALLRAHEHDAKGMTAVGFVAGLVPCPLTLFVMVFAITRGIAIAGVTFAVAMMIGIAATLCAVAIASVLARNAATDVLERWSGPMTRVSRLLTVTGGVAIIAVAARDLLI